MARYMRRVPNKQRLDFEHEGVELCIPFQTKNRKEATDAQWTTFEALFGLQGADGSS